MTVRIEQLGTTDFEEVVDREGAPVAPTRPGDVLQHDFMKPLGLTASALARALGVPVNRITSIVNGGRRVSADTALRLARYFGTTPELWLNLQSQYDLAISRSEHGDEIIREIQPRRARVS